MLSRSAGVLLHATSLPNKCLDEHAYRFVDWLSEIGVKVWQVLPLNPPVEGISPYHCESTFALNTDLLPENIEYDQTELNAYLASEPHWLDDYAIFKTLKHKFNDLKWCEWPEKYKSRDPQALFDFSKEHQCEILRYKKEQFLIEKCWAELKAYANQKGVQLFGDMPIFVVYDSADVWVNAHQFKLGDDFYPEVVTGVPPDYFAVEGQRWGNPHYNWDDMRGDGFKWWLSRVKRATEIFDILRIDHFRGFEAVWEIQRHEKTAINGRWVKSPGEELLALFQMHFPSFQFVAEDLGMITPEVLQLKNQFNLPGMIVLQFGFDGSPDNPHAVHNIIENAVIYTGTHDNDTTEGWYATLDEHTKNMVQEALKNTDHTVSVSWRMIEAAMKSSARLAVFPMQDLLGLLSNARMNTPGEVSESNWRWQFDWRDLTEDISNKFSTLIEVNGRNAIGECK